MTGIIITELHGKQAQMESTLRQVLGLEWETLLCSYFPGKSPLLGMPGPDRNRQSLDTVVPLTSPSPNVGSLHLRKNV